MSSGVCLNFYFLGRNACFHQHSTEAETLKILAIIGLVSVQPPGVNQDAHFHGIFVHLDRV